MSIQFASVLPPTPPNPIPQRHSPVHSPDDPKIALLGERRGIRDGAFSERWNMTQHAQIQPPVLIAEQRKVGAGDGNRTHLAGLGSRLRFLHNRNREIYLPKFA